MTGLAVCEQGRQPIKGVAWSVAAQDLPWHLKVYNKFMTLLAVHRHTRSVRLCHLWGFHLHRSPVRVRASMWRKMSVSTMSQRGRARCHGAADRHKHISCVCCLKEPEKESGTEGEVWWGGQTGRDKRWREETSVSDWETPQQPHQSQLLGSLPLLPWLRGTVRNPGGRGCPKNLQLSLNSGETEMELRVHLLPH